MKIRRVRPRVAGRPAQVLARAVPRLGTEGLTTVAATVVPAGQARPRRRLAVGPLRDVVDGGRRRGATSRPSAIPAGRVQMGDLAGVGLAVAA